eukprot:TRINITY_DN7258_c0_g1_i3.p1 TRINITY_DN7258_c0_g1~~TRINITY_DN7258_c0_g1_i3.p1  ORF type:complete len:349 (+),score=66.09 TRINITY_DN7258_c0_g1_i3:153-1049(+)
MPFLVAAVAALLGVIAQPAATVDADKLHSKHGRHHHGHHGRLMRKAATGDQLIDVNVQEEAPERSAITSVSLEEDDERGLALPQKKTKRFQLGSPGPPGPRGPRGPPGEPGPEMVIKIEGAASRPAIFSTIIFQIVLMGLIFMGIKRKVAHLPVVAAADAPAPGPPAEGAVDGDGPEKAVGADGEPTKPAAEDGIGDGAAGETGGGADGEKPPQDGEKPPQDGEKPPEDGEKPPQDGESGAVADDAAAKVAGEGEASAGGESAPATSAGPGDGEAGTATVTASDAAGDSAEVAVAAQP